jgi:hypothetical protein
MTNIIISALSEDRLSQLELNTRFNPTHNNQKQNIQMKKATLLIAVFLLIPLLAMAQTTVTVSSNITTDTEWTADNEYLLDGMIFVTEGADLYIEAGTTVRGGEGQDLDASGLVITRGSRIFAEGTAENPIIFTAENDEGLTKDDVGEWGGIILLGRATTNNTVEATIEGVNEITDDAALVGYGGNNDMDDSGILRYVSIRHTGINIGSSSGNEIQGLTMGGVGAGTTIEYIESFASGDDGYEWFGGTVNARYLVSAFNEDDAFDWDQGFRGKGQFWFAILDSDQTGRAAEMDGAGGNETGTPYAFPMVSNVTYIGPGMSSTPSGDSGQMLQFRDNTGAWYTNSVFTDHPGDAVNVEDVDGTDIDSRGRLEADSLTISNSVFFGFGSGDTFADIASADFVETMLSSNSNEITDPMLRGISRTNDGGLDPRPKVGSPVYGMAEPVGDSWFYGTNYVGAFDGSNWLAGWTALDSYGYLGDGLVTDTEDEFTSLPKEIALNQNYPNPFNPTTQISFTLPQAQQVTLKVYDILGREVATLANRRAFTAGQNTLSFDASSLSSGVYIYKLVSGDVSMSRKMMLIK